jgi:hypothetical protein
VGRRRPSVGRIHIAGEQALDRRFHGVHERALDFTYQRVLADAAHVLVAHVLHQLIVAVHTRAAFDQQIEDVPGHVLGPDQLFPRDLDAQDFRQVLRAGEQHRGDLGNGHVHRHQAPVVHEVFEVARRSS